MIILFITCDCNRQYSELTLIKLNPEQSAAVHWEHQKGELLVLAGAGAGKTGVR